MTLFHGSEKIVKQPAYGAGSAYNDYGRGFYTTRDKGLAGEWAVLMTKHDGFINEYTFNDSFIYDSAGNIQENELKTLKLDSLGVKAWVALLIDNREGEFLEDPTILDIAKAFKQKYLPDISEYDIITGWRADDSYFRFAEDFVIGRLSVENLEKAMMLGNLGQQVCIKSERAFSPLRLKFVASHKAELKMFYASAKGKDSDARREYAKLIKSVGARTGTLIQDLI